MSGLEARYLEDVIGAARAVDLAAVGACLDALEAAYRGGNAVYVIGNGGSAANASHFAQDLAKGAMPDFENGRPFRAVSLTDNVAFMTAIANDIGYDRVFDLQLRQSAAAGDLLVAISGSGNSANILRAAEAARALGMRLVAFTGFDGGKLGGLADVHVHVPLHDMCQAEAVHSILFHLLVDMLRARLTDSPAT